MEVPPLQIDHIYLEFTYGLRIRGGLAQDFDAKPMHTRTGLGHLRARWMLRSEPQWFECANEEHSSRVSSFAQVS